MPFSSLYTFHYKTVALAGDCHPFQQHDKPNEDNSSLPWFQCFVLPYLGYGIANEYKVFVTSIVDRVFGWCLSSSCTATYHPTWKLSKLDELDMRDTAGEVGTSS